MRSLTIQKSNFPVRYSFDQDQFYIDSPLSIDPHFRETLLSIEMLKNITRGSNELVEIKSANIYKDDVSKDERIIIETENLKNYHPLTLMKTNIGLYTDEEIGFIRDKFERFIMSDLKFLEEFYKSIVYTYQRFIDRSGFYFFDISSNNIMINKENYDFKIIDILSIKKVDFEKKKVDPVSVLLYHNIVKHQAFDRETISEKCKKFNEFFANPEGLIAAIQKIRLIKPLYLYNKER